MIHSATEKTGSRTLGATDTLSDPPGLKKKEFHSQNTIEFSPETYNQDWMKLIGVSGAEGTALGQRLSQFNKELQALPEAQKKQKYDQMVAATAAPLPDLLASRGNIAAFLDSVYQVQKSDVVVPPHIKSAHTDGISGTIEIESTGNVPDSLASANSGFIRLGPGAKTAMPGFGLLLFNEDKIESRVLFNRKGSSFDQTLFTSALGVSTAGPEGELKFTPSSELRGISFVDGQGKSTSRWMQELSQLAPGTTIGTIQPADSSDKFSLTLRTNKAGPGLSYNKFAEMNSRFPRQLKGRHLLGSLVLGAVKFAEFVIR